MNMRSIASLLVLGATAVFAQQPDPAFDRIPFDDWLKNPNEGHLRWTLKLVYPRLSGGFRYSAGLQAIVDMPEFLKRSEKDRLIVFVEIRNSENRVYRGHRAYALPKHTNPANLRDIRVVQSFSILPGDYQIAVALYDSVTQEHSLKRARLHVPDGPRDLAGLWRDFPSVDFSGRPVSFELKTEKPVRIELVVVLPLKRREMYQVNPWLRMMTAVKIANGSMRVSVLDLERRKVIFHQEIREPGGLNWRILSRMEGQSNPNMIDVASLQNYTQNAQFFASEISSRLENPDPLTDRVVIVLATPRTFPRQEDLHPIDAKPAAGGRLFYVLCKRRAPGSLATTGIAVPRGAPIEAHDPLPIPPPRPPAVDPNEDSLTRVLKPVNPRIYKVDSINRRALESLLVEISQSK